MRLKLAGGDRPKGSGVLCPWRGTYSRPLLLRWRASRPQLKRDPLGRRRAFVSRTQSLYARLEHLEAHFAARLLAEVEREAKRCSSMFLLWRMTPYFGGKIYRSQRVEDLE